MTSNQQAAREWLPCPFCNGTNTQMRTSTFWTGMRSEVISATVMHWCDRGDGQLQSVLQIKAKTEDEAAEKWNRRPTPAVGADARRFRGVGELERTGYIPEGSAAEREAAKPSSEEE